MTLTFNIIMGGALTGAPFNPAPYQRELDAIKGELGRRVGTLITEPYLGGGGSYHPPEEYLRLLESFCRDNNIVFILDEVQANFGRRVSPRRRRASGFELFELPQRGDVDLQHD